MAELILPLPMQIEIHPTAERAPDSIRRVADGPGLADAANFLLSDRSPARIVRGAAGGTFK